MDLFYDFINVSMRWWPHLTSLGRVLKKICSNNEKCDDLRPFPSQRAFSWTISEHRKITTLTHPTFGSFSIAPTIRLGCGLSRMSPSFICGWVTNNQPALKYRLTKQNEIFGNWETSRSWIVYKWAILTKTCFVQRMRRLSYQQLYI